MPRYNVLLRDDKSFPLHPSHRRPRLSAARPSIRGARDKGGAYFGPFASAGAVNRTLDHAAEGVPAALVQRQRLRQPHPALPAVPDQALQRALRRPHRQRGLRGAGRARRSAFLSGSSARRAAAARRARWRRRRDALDFEAAALLRDRIRALVAGAGAPGHPRRRDRRCRRHRRASGGRADLRPGVLLPRRPELGQPRLFPEPRPAARRSRRC